MDTDPVSPKKSAQNYYVLTGIDGAGVFNCWDAMGESKNFAAKITVTECGSLKEACDTAYQPLKRIEPQLKEDLSFVLNFYQHKKYIKNKDRYDQ